MKYKWLVVGLLGLLVVAWGINLVREEKNRWNNDDFKMAFVSDNGLILRTVSWQRGMVNEMDIDGKTSVWIPEGMGWYQSNKIGRLLKQENKESLASKMFFYNLGFVPDVVVFGDGDNWLGDKSVTQKWGILNTLRYWYFGPKMMVKQESIKGDLLNQPEDLGDVVQRDFADSRLLKDDLRLTVYNESQYSGMASFVAKALEWSGLTVVGIENNVGTIDKTCVVDFGAKADKTAGFEVLKLEFEECSFAKDKELNENEAELYIGDKFSQMLNYPSYK